MYFDFKSTLESVAAMRLNLPKPSHCFCTGGQWLNFLRFSPAKRIRKLQANNFFGAALVSLLCGLMQPATSEQHTLQPEFTFKRIGVPAAGSGNRITVQIAPQATNRALAPVSTSDRSSQAPATELAWFWDIVSPKRSDSRPGRLFEAIAALDKAPDGAFRPSPRLQTMKDIVAAHGSDIILNSIGTDISPALIVALISVESGGAIDAVSHAGATGLMQLMPDTAARFGVTDAAHPADNIKGGAAYLSWLMDHFDNDPILALAGYNAGEGAVRDNEGVPPYRETRNYVPKVIAAWTIARGLCKTPPELVTDGCAFFIDG